MRCRLIGNDDVLRSSVRYRTEATKNDAKRYRLKNLPPNLPVNPGIGSVWLELVVARRSFRPVLTAVVGIGTLIFTGATFGAGQFWERKKWNQGKKSLEGRPSTDRVRRAAGKCSFRVTNAGKSTITHLRPQLFDSADNLCSESEGKNVINLLAGEREDLTLRLIAPGDQDPLHLHYDWVDDSTRETRRLKSRASIPTA